MNVLDAFFARAASRPEAVAIRDGEDFRTYGWMASAVGGMADALRGAGCFDCPSGHVPRVALKCPNGVEHVLWALAIVRGGGCLVPVPPESNPAECRELLARTGCAALVECGGHRANVSAAGCAALVMALENGADGVIPEEVFAGLDPVLIRFSSGTTGESKGVVLSNRSLVERIASGNRRLSITDCDRVLWVLPMAHHFAVSILLYLSCGATTVLSHSRMGDDMLDAALRHRATVFYGSPFHLAVLGAESSGRAWPDLRLAVSTAAPLREEVASAFHRRYGVPATQGYGIIEAGLPFLNTRDAMTNALRCGVPDDFQARLVGEARDGEQGELWLKGPGMFDAYLSPWRLRSEVLEEGWFRTGDLAVRESGGAMRLTGRLKSVINVGGMKCFPEEIEAVLSNHPGVKECRVSGVTDRRWGMVPIAEIVAADPVLPPAEEDLVAHCSRVLASHKVPVAFRFEEMIPKTASGKIKRVDSTGEASCE
jgi:long-chain acyl-CoA synthetase